MDDYKHGITVTSRDRLMTAWRVSMDLVREYEAYAKQEHDNPLGEVFAEYAEDVGLHAARLRELLLHYEK